MTRARFSLFYLAMIVLSGAISRPVLARSSATQTQKEVIAYVFVKDRALRPEEIAPELLTRVNYAFANIQDGKLVAGFAHDHENFQTLNDLKERNPKLKVLVSVGGWTWSGRFSDMCLTRSSRRAFIESAIRFIRENNLDGLDIDWEYPAQIGDGNIYRTADKRNFTALLREFHQAFDRQRRVLKRRLILSIAVGASAQFIANTEMSQVQRYVDTVNLMSYDYYEPDSDKVTGHHAPLYVNPDDPKSVSADASVKLFEQAGVPARKLVLGIPFYGHVWSDVADTNHGLYQAGKKTEVWAPYREIEEKLLNSGFDRYWDSSASAPYLYNLASRTFVTYDDPQSVELKCRYVLLNDLGGVMYWDDSGDTADHRMLASINHGLVKIEGNPSTVAARDGRN